MAQLHFYLSQNKCSFPATPSVDDDSERGRKEEIFEMRWFKLCLVTTATEYSPDDDDDANTMMMMMMMTICKHPISVDKVASQECFKVIVD